MKTLAAFLLLVCTARAVDYPIVYVRAPNVGTRAPHLQDFRNQVDVEPGASLMLLHPDGREEVLFAPPDPNGGVFDCCPDVLAVWVYFAYTQDGTTADNNSRFPGPTHIYKINVATREVVQLTHDSDDQPLAPDTFYGDKLKLHNTAPCPLPDGRVIFTSNRNRLLRAVQKANGNNRPEMVEPVFQLFAMDADGQNVEQIDHRSLRGCLHPFLLKDGRIAFSSLENHGLRTKPDQWWTLLIANPDLTHWEPSFSYGGEMVDDLSGVHFAGQGPDGDLFIEDYYPGKDGGVTGIIYRWAVGAPHGNPNRLLNPALSGSPGGRQFPFQPIGMRVVTPWGSRKDAGTWGAGQPSGAPDGVLITRGMAAQPTPWASTRGVVECGIYLMPGGDAPLMTDLVLIKDDPAYWELQPKALVPFDQIYGAMPPVIPRCPNPTGEPFAYVGTSGVYARESERFGNNNDAAKPDVWVQGGDVGTYSNADIHAIRILVQYPTPHRGQSALWDVHGVERMAVLGEIPLRKFDAMGNPILDSNGDPDTSFKAKIPADTSFTFQLLDEAGQVLTHSMTWHQLRPGEERTNCRGCHKHSQPPGIEFEGTFASRPEYEPVDLSHAAPVHVEWFRDIKPIMDAHCAECHTDPANESGVVIDDNFRSHTAVKHFKSRISTLLARLTDPDTATRMPKGADPLTAEQIKTIATWIDLGSGRADPAGLFWQDNLRPTLTVEASTAGLTIGAYDVDSGPVVVAATLDGQPLTLTQAGDVWTHGALTGAEVTVTATDTAGNVSRRVVTVGEPTPDPDPDPMPPLTDRQRIERLETEVFGEPYPGGGIP